MSIVSWWSWVTQLPIHKYATHRSTVCVVSRLQCPRLGLGFFLLLSSLWMLRHVRRMYRRRWIVAQKVWQPRVETVSCSLGTQTSARIRAPVRFVILTIGTRGDVQPFVALGQALKANGHCVRLCTLDEFKPFVEGAGLEFASAGMHRIEQPTSWLKATSLAQFLQSTAHLMVKDFTPVSQAMWAATANVDAVITNLFAQNQAIDYATARKVPCWVVKMCPDVPSRFMGPFGQPSSSVGIVNLIRHYQVLIASVQAAGAVKYTELQNQFRKAVLGLPVVGIERFTDLHAAPSLLAYSPTLVPPPPDYEPWRMTTGFWMLDSDTAYRPPAAVAAFFATGSAPVCVTFGSMAIVDGTNVMKHAVEAALLAGRRVVVISGWSQAQGLPVTEPDQLLCVQELPYSWLFPRCAAVIHHGGAGTTAAACQAGVPSVIVPILKWYDQAGWARTVERLGIGLHVPEPTVPALQVAVERVVDNNPTMAATLQSVGRQMQAEHGVAAAVTALESCVCQRVIDKQGACPSASAWESLRRNCIACHMNK